MYYCNDCKEYFGSPKEVDDGCYEECWGAKVWRSDMAEYCPCCGSEDFQESGICEVCGENIPNASEDYCDECVSIANRYINDLADNLKVIRSTAKDLILSIIEKES